MRVWEMFLKCFEIMERCEAIPTLLILRSSAQIFIPGFKDSYKSQTLTTVALL